MEERKVWVVTTNTDCTEGRGTEYVKAVCELEATARRLAKGGYIQGTDCPITTKTMLFHEGEWYAPAVLTRPTADDEKEEIKLKARRELQKERQAIIQKARDLGLTDGELTILLKMEN